MSKWVVGQGGSTSGLEWSSVQHTYEWQYDDNIIMLVLQGLQAAEVEKNS